LERTDGAGAFQIKNQLHGGLQLVDVLSPGPRRPEKSPLQLSRWDQQMGGNRQVEGLKQEIDVSTKGRSRHFGRHQEPSAKARYATSQIQAMEADRLGIDNHKHNLGSTNNVESFIRLAQKDETIKQQLADCSVELWDSAHLPLDIDINKVISVAKDYGFHLTMKEIINTQCNKLAEFWQFEMGNAFVARRSLSLIQYQISDGLPIVDYYLY